MKTNEIKSKYWDVYKKSKSRDDFVNKAMKEFTGLVRATAIRSYNKLKQKETALPKDIPIKQPIEVHKEKPVKTQKNGQLDDDNAHISLQQFKSVILPDATNVLEDLLMMPITKIKNRGFIDVRHIVQILIKHTTLREQVHKQESRFYIPSRNSYSVENGMETMKPDALKLLTIEDMVSRGFKPSRDFLKKYGFTDSEINWLVKNKLIQKEDEQ